MPACHAGGRGFESLQPRHFYCLCDPLAQPVEHLTFNEGADGSNPSRVTIYLLLQSWPLHLTVRIHGFHPCHRGSNPLGVTKPFATYGRLAQLVERYPYKVDVISSSLISTTTFLKVIKCSSIRFLKIFL